MVFKMNGNYSGLTHGNKHHAQKHVLSELGPQKFPAPEACIHPTSSSPWADSCAELRSPWLQGQLTQM